MNILNNKNKRKSIFKALALCLFAAVSLTAVSCDDDMDIQQSYPFTVEIMPVPNKVTKGQTVEIRCELKKTGDYANTLLIDIVFSPKLFDFFAACRLICLSEFVIILVLIFEDDCTASAPTDTPGTVVFLLSVIRIPP